MFPLVFCLLIPFHSAMLSAAAPAAVQLNLTTNFPGLQTLNTTPLFSKSNPVKANTSTGVPITHISINVPNSSTRLEIWLPSFLDRDSIFLLLDRVQDWVEFESHRHDEQWWPLDPFRCYNGGASLGIRNQPGQHITLLVLGDIVEGLNIVLVRGGIEKQAKFNVYHEGMFVAKGQLRSSRPGRQFRCSRA